MSGGSYNYLCFKDTSEILSNQDDLERMVERLAELGYAEDAAREADELLLMIRQFVIRCDVRLKRLNPIFKAVEWWDSCDWSEDSVKQALDKYRGENGNV